MITYICRNKDEKGENLPCTNNRCETSAVNVEAVKTVAP